MPERKMLTKPQRAMFEKSIPQAIVEGKLSIGDQTVEVVVEQIKALIVGGILSPKVTFDEWLEYLRNPGGIAAPVVGPQEAIGAGDEINAEPEGVLSGGARESLATDVLGVPIEPITEPESPAVEPVSAEFAGTKTERWIDAYRVAKEKLGKIEAMVERCRTEIEAAMTEENVDTALVNGAEAITWRYQERKTFATKAWKEAHPDEVGQWTQVTKTRTFLLK